MALETGKNYVFEEFRLETEKRMLIRRGGEQIRLANRPFQVLFYLIENRDRIVSRNELLEKFWDGREVYDLAVTKCVGAIRKALDEPHENPRFIETRWAGGYRFIGNVEEQPAFRSSFVEIEKTREVKLILEESNENGTLSDTETRGRGDAEKNPSNKLESKISNLKLQTMNRRVAASPRRRVLTIAAGAVLVLAVGAFVLSRYQQNKPAPIRSIAVLPFKNLSSNPNGEIFTDGMTESLIGSLSRIEGLKVISRNSVSVFKGKDADPRKIAEKLGIETFIEGNVRENGGRIRVEVRLVNAENGEILWSGDDYDRAVGDVLEIQDEIARSVATRLRLKLTSADEQHLTKRQTNNPEAYQAFVKGRYFWKKKDAENLEKARKFFEEAIRLDPNYALAYAGLADYYLTGIWYADFAPIEATKNAKTAVAKVLEIDDQLPEAHTARARIAETEWDWETYGKELEKALELNPNDANYWQGYAFFLRNLAGRFDEAVTAIKRAQELDPLSVSINTDVGVMLTHAGRYDEAIETFKKTLETDPQFFDAYWNLGLAYERKGMNTEAVAAFIESERLKGRNEERFAVYCTGFEQADMRGFWQKWLEFGLVDAKEKNVPAYVIAAWYARAGEKEAALEWLEKSYAAHEPYLVNLKSEFAFDSLRSDSRFKDLLRRVGLDK